MSLSTDKKKCHHSFPQTTGGPQSSELQGQSLPWATARFQAGSSSQTEQMAASSGHPGPIPPNPTAEREESKEECYPSTMSICLRGRSPTWGSQIPLVLGLGSCCCCHSPTTRKSRPSALTWANSQQTCKNRRKQLSRETRTGSPTSMADTAQLSLALTP